ncbi:MAG: hypothetical protein JSV04_02145 [Candidatus Heimdallarchaeota archaeon]|nr:MAG: hypothetical protein JSV04_02145 [Candidatus Heimdallarchaeota archaeon]
MLETFLIDQGILRPQRVRLLCTPDYLFFRTHSHRLYREFKGIPRYSIITRKVTDQLDSVSTNSQPCSLETLFIVDGSTALKNAPFYFPLAKLLDLSIVGMNLDIIELPKLRYMSPPDQKVQKYEPIALVSSEVHFHAPLQETGLESKTITLPTSSFDLYPQPIIPITQNTIAVGSVRDINEFFPHKFDVLRINLGDFVEYTQRFSPPSKPSGSAKKAFKREILEEVGKIVHCFHIPIVLVSFYKISKFMALDSESTAVQHVQDICDHWSFSESMLINNEKRREWSVIRGDPLDQFFDAQGYIAVFNRLKKPKPIKTSSLEDQSYSFDEEFYFD